MFIPTVSDAPASTDCAAISSDPTHTKQSNPERNRSEQGQKEPIRHMLFGSLTAVRATIQTLHKRGYAEPNDWSQPISTGRANEVMSILTKRLPVEY